MLNVEWMGFGYLVPSPAMLVFRVWKNTACSWTADNGL